MVLSQFVSGTEVGLELIRREECAGFAEGGFVNFFAAAWLGSGRNCL